MADTQPVLYDRTFGFGALFTAILVVAPLIAPGAILLAVLHGEPLVGGARDALIISGSVAAVILFGILGLIWRMRVVVTPVELTIIWGYLGWLRCRFALANVESFQVVTFSPLRDFGGWGWRFGRDGRRCYNTRGNQGVELVIGGRGYVVGVDDPEELSVELETALGRKRRAG